MTAPALKLIKDSPYHETEPLLSCVCDERGNSVTRNVYLATFTPQFLRDLWEKQKKFRTLMGVEILTFDEFVDFFVFKDSTGKLIPKGICLVVDELVGIYWISDIRYPGYCEVHYTFFDRRLNGRLNLTKKAIKWVFDYWNINLMYVQVAVYAEAPIQFVDAIGFKREGRLRNRAHYKGQWYDVISYSLTREEANEFERVS